MAGIDNLTKDGTIKSSEQAREMGKIGGVKSGEARRQRRAMRETLELLLDVPIRKGKPISSEKIKNIADLKGKNLSVEQAMLLAQIQKAIRGDTSAFLALRDTSGNKPKDEVSVEGQIPVVISGEDDLED